MAIIDHFGTQPSTVTNAILSGLSVLQKVNGGAGHGGTGVVATIQRIAGDGYRDDDLDQYLQRGLPAILVSYEGGDFKRHANNQTLQQVMRFAIICIAGEMTSVRKRLDDNYLVNPGVEELLDMASYYGYRAIDAISGIRSATIDKHQWLSIIPGRYAASVSMSAVRDFDVWGDDPSVTLSKLGIVHNPIDYNDLWESDNITPKSTLPSDVSGGVFAL